MPSFKPKAQKKIRFNKKTVITLDTKHKEFLNEFSQDESITIPELKIERQNLRQTLNGNVDNLTVEKRLDIEDKIKDLSERIKKVNNKKKEYLLDNSKYVFEYFENKKNISNGETIIEKTNKSKLVDAFFKIKKETENDSTKKYEANNSNIVQKYLSNVDDMFIDVNTFVFQTDICQVCYKGELIPLEDEGILVCNNCSRSVKYLIENEKPSYKEPPKEVCFYAYKRINHFKEILAQFQGKETTQIPHEVIENIKLQIKKERIDMDQITNLKTKEILKKLGYNKYYEHIPFIKDKLGIKPPIMSQELEETLCNLFIDLQAPYSKFCPDDRVNFLNYYYTAFKLCELLGEDHYLPHFPMLKDKEKRVEQDTIWKKICEDLDWEFIPTI
jgi:Poxvirus Late Transcription Factor VLTF3 like